MNEEKLKKVANILQSSSCFKFLLGEVKCDKKHSAHCCVDLGEGEADCTDREEVYCMV